MNKYIDHTLLKANASEADIINLCNEAIENDFMAVCVNPSFIETSKLALKDSDVKVCTVIGFPLGANTTEVKVFETKDALKRGADEIDLVLNISKLLDKDYDYVLAELKAVREVAAHKVLKVIIETAYLQADDIIKASELCLEANVDFVKTSTGFASRGASLEDINLIKSVTKDLSGIKSAGGVRSYDDLVKMIKAGATRIGTSSGVALLKKEDSNSSY